MRRTLQVCLGIILGASLATGCINSGSDNVTPQGPTGTSKPSGGWIIPEDQVLDGGPGKDGIPSVDDPQFVPATEVNYLEDNDLVIGIAHNGIVRAYPHVILDWHEIVNDELGDMAVAVTYCPLTGTATGWDREFQGGTTTFGVSGLLYNTNLIPYDRETDSNWSQMRLQCVQGSRQGELIELHHIVETTWGTWQKMYPETQIMTLNTGFNRSYGFFPYGGYRTNNDDIRFPIEHRDERRPAKERVLGVIFNSNARVYSIEDMTPLEGVTVIEDDLNGLPLVVAGSKGLNFAVAFENTVGLRFTAVQDELPVVMVDEEGSKWDVFGRAVSGPREGEQLKTTRSYIGYFFAWGAFYQGMSIFQP